MIIETLDHGEIYIRGHETATDGIYIPAATFALKHDVPEATVRVWARRGNIETVHIFRCLFVKKGCEIKYRRSSDHVQKV